MYSKMMLPIQLTKILYSDWKGTISISSQDSQIYGKCLNGPGEVTFKNGNRYVGEFRNGLLSGKGKFTWANGIKYDGQFTDNRITGLGIYTWPDGSHYQGQVKDGLRHGSGIYRIDDATYQGDWKNGKKEGKGKIVFKSGSIFEGQFKNDLKHGYGKMYYYPSGNYFQGYWQKDLKEGQGTMNWTDLRQKYFGQWHQNYQHGWGVHIWLQSKGQGKYLRNRYEGNWAKGVREGYGTFYYANGSKYEGFWENNMKQGFAFYTNENGKISHLLFDKDRMLRSGNQPKFQELNKKVSSKKQVQPNTYALCLQIQHFYRPFTPNLEALYNLLLRNNTQLKYWYKGLSNFYDQQSEYSFCLNLEGIWKMIRALKVLGDISLAQMDRGLRQNIPNICQLLKKINKHQQQVQFEEIFYASTLQSVKNKYDRKCEEECSEEKEKFFPFKQYNVHNRAKNILFRQFVHLLVWIANSLNPGSQKPQKSVQSILTKVTPMLQNISKTIKTGTSDNISQNLSSVSKAEKNISLHFRTVNKNLLESLSVSPQKRRLNQYDLTMRVRELFGIGRRCKIFAEQQLGLFERIVDKFMDPEILSKPLSQHYKNSTLPTKIINVMNYELIEYEFTEMLYFLLIKKLPNHRQTEQNKAKYDQFCTNLKQEKSKIDLQKIEEYNDNNQQRILVSRKATLKKQLAKKRTQMQAMKKKQQEQQNRLKREKIEREQMTCEDKDIKQLQFEEEESQLEI